MAGQLGFVSDILSPLFSEVKTPFFLSDAPRYGQMIDNLLDTKTIFLWFPRGTLLVSGVYHREGTSGGAGRGW